MEWPASKQAKLDSRYQAYLEGDYVLTRHEVDQLGLRIARQLGLPRVDAGDWNEAPPGADADYDFEAWPKTPDAKVRLAALRDPRSMHEEPLAGRTVARWLAALNTPEHLALMNRRYFDFALLGDGVRDPGANWVAAWYGRNLKIFGRLVRLADKPGDRVLVIFGAGHAFLLQQDADQSHALKVVSPEPLLTGPR